MIFAFFKNKTKKLSFSIILYAFAARMFRFFVYLPFLLWHLANRPSDFTLSLSLSLHHRMEIHF